tara:strand:- start:239 stop:508 length:270 start_codon:yes stop_codon:yes gene_type:complete
LSSAITPQHIAFGSFSHECEGLLSIIGLSQKIGHNIFFDGVVNLALETNLSDPTNKILVSRTDIVIHYLNAILIIDFTNYLATIGGYYV